MRPLELVFVGIIFFVPQAAVGFITEANIPNKVRFALAVGSVACLALTQTARQYYLERRFRNRLASEWQSLLTSLGRRIDVDTGQEHLARLLVQTPEDDSVPACVATELSLSALSTPIVVFVPDASEQVELLFSRLYRALSGSGLRPVSRSRNPGTGLALMVSPTQSTVDRELLAKIETLFGATEEASARIVYRLLARRRGAVTLFVTAMSATDSEIVSWLGEAVPSWCARVVLATNNEVCEKLLQRYKGIVGTVHGLQRQAGDVRIEEVDTILEERLVNLSARLRKPKSQLRQDLLDLSLYLVAADIVHPEAPGHALPRTSTGWEELARACGDWFVADGPKAAPRFQWRPADLGLRSYLPAVAVHRKAQQVKRSDLERINNDVRYSYVRLFLDHLDRDRPTHLLALFGHTALHRLLRFAWQTEAVDPEYLDQSLAEAVADQAAPWIDTRDLLQILRFTLQHGFVDRYQSFFSGLPEDSVASAIFDPAIPREHAAGAMVGITTIPGILRALEQASSVPPLLEHLLAIGSPAAVQLMMAVVISPHGPSLPREFSEELRKASEAGNPWTILNDVTAGEHEVSVLSMRIIETADLMSDAGKKWLKRLEECQGCFKLAARLVASIANHQAAAAAVDQVL